MIIKIIDNSGNEMFNEIINKIGNDKYSEIEKEVNAFCDKCAIDSAISLVSCYGKDWTSSAMQAVYDVVGDHDKAALYAGVIFKEIIKNSKYRFEIVKGKNGINLYYKRA